MGKERASGPIYRSAGRTPAAPGQAPSAARRGYIILCYPRDHKVSGIIRGRPSRPTQAKVVEASHIR